MLSKFKFRRPLMAMGCFTTLLLLPLWIVLIPVRLVHVLLTGPRA